MQVVSWNSIRLFGLHCCFAFVDAIVTLLPTGRGPYEGGSVPSSGLVGVLILLQICKNVTVYGYGHDHPDDLQPRAVRVPYHYFSGFGSRSHGVAVHSWHAEEMLLHQLARENRITFCRPLFHSNMQNYTTVQAHNRVCGLNPELNALAQQHWLQRINVGTDAAQPMQS